MYDAHNAIVADICDTYQLVDDAVLSNLKNASRDLDRSIASLLIERGHVRISELLDSVAEFLGLDRCEHAPSEIPAEVTELIESSMAWMYGAVPIEATDYFVVVLATDPFNGQVVDDLSFAIGREVRVQVTDPAVVGELLEVYYRTGDDQYSGILEEIDLKPSGTGEEDLSAEDLLEMAGETPIIRYVNLVLAQAIKDKASDIHFEPFEKEFKIRYRIDGALYEMSPPPRELSLPITSRIKVVANLNIAERRVPQDGKVRLTISGRPVDLRISTLPTQFGESVVLRVLDQSATSLELDSIGMPQDVLKSVTEVISRPNGIFIVTGPTGSGKTTTLYSCLKRLNLVGSKLMTAEDPIEYEIDGIMQVNVNSAIGLSFANTLKSFLRQDPDIIMVGEIRDLETAQIAIQSSLTGHLVLSTLHTNDASGAITRLMDMGIEPFLIASSVEAVLAQRLLRRICIDCREAYTPSAALLNQLELDPSVMVDKEFYRGEGCRSCANTGYRGRLGIFELLTLSEEIRETVGNGEASMSVRDQALEQGMRTLRDDGLRSIFTGATSIEEVLRYT
ncbi:MAG: ATPase, T2SS/T4P/T4SS family [Verrucomicrobiota bacterium]